MEGKTVRLDSDDERWLEMTVQDDRATARVGGAQGVGESFPFSFEHLGFVARGMGYQAWGSGSHFAFRHEPRGVVVEFQAPGDRGAAICRLTQEGMRATLDALDVFAPSGAARASVL